MGSAFLDECTGTGRGSTIRSTYCKGKDGEYWGAFSPTGREKHSKRTCPCAIRDTFCWRGEIDRKRVADVSKIRNSGKYGVFFLESFSRRERHPECIPGDTHVFSVELGNSQEKTSWQGNFC